MINTSALFIALATLLSCNKPHTKSNSNDPGDSTKTNVEFWLTNTDQSVLFKKQNAVLSFSSGTNSNTTIAVDTTTTYQTMDGYGFALTGGSAYLINHMSPANEDALLKELFATDSNNIGISYLRISIGASDLDSAVFTFDEMPAGQTDTLLSNFSISPDLPDLVPVLKKIIAINPAIKILSSPWTPPLWMKTNDNSIGGNFNHQYYNVYANYFVKYIQAMQSQGITIDAVTLQNEPMYGGNNPSMLFSAQEEAEFIKNYVGPAFQSAGINTKIIVFDHNCSDPQYPLAILSDADASKYVDGSAFHLYAGDVSALSTVHNDFPAKNVYFTEQWVGGPSNFAGDFSWAINHLVIGASNNWAKCVLQWNLANDPQYKPHTPGGCSSCLGAVTIGSTVVRNTAYYTIAHASKFVRPGSVRVSSTVVAGFANVAFVTPSGKKVLIVQNVSNATQTFNISFKNKIVSPTLSAGAVGTFIW